MNNLDLIIDAWHIETTGFTSPIWLPGKTRVDLAKLFRFLGYTKGAEIGVLDGDYSSILARENRQATIYSIDAWKVYRGYGDHTDHASLKAHQRKAEQCLSSFQNVVLSYKTSMEAVNDFDDGQLDFVYIDANHELPYITQDIYYWSRKIKGGGIIAGHDYLNEPRPDGRCHVREACGAYTKAFGIAPWFVIGSSKYALSWFWVKP